MKSRILNLGRVRPEHVSRGREFELGIARVGTKVGSRKLGFNVTEIPPGKKSWPFHFHHANEELFFILEGRGSIRIAGAPPGRATSRDSIRHYTRVADRVPYWEGED